MVIYTPKTEHLFYLQVAQPFLASFSSSVKWDSKEEHPLYKFVSLSEVGQQLSICWPYLLSLMILLLLLIQKDPEGKT